VTLWVSRKGARLELACTSGALEVRVNEDPGHLRHFWSELGRQLDALEHEKMHAAADAARAERERAESLAMCADPEDPDDTR
jgi:hypothetical protein